MLDLFYFFICPALDLIISKVEQAYLHLPPKKVL